MGRSVAAVPVLVLLAFPVFARSGDSTLFGADAVRASVFASTGRGTQTTAFSPNDHLSDLFLPLREDGKVGGLAVVVPSEREFTDSDLSSWKAYIGGISPGADNAFVLREGAFFGEVRGMDIRVFPVHAWKEAAASGPVLLDLSFLVAMYKDEVRTPFVELPGKFLATIRGRKVDPGRVTPWVVNRYDLPLERGYLPKLVSEALREPPVFLRGLPRKWESLKIGEQLVYLGLYEQAILHFDTYLKEEPEDPSILYRIASTWFVDGDPDRGLRYLHRAFKADPYYIRAYSASAFTLFRKGDQETAERVVRAGLRQEPEFLDLKVGLGRILLAQAKKILATDPGEAQKRYAETGPLGLPAEFREQFDKEWEEAKSSPASGGGMPPGMPRGHGSGGHGP